MQAHRIHTTVSGDGSVTVRDLPFAEGEEVEVIVLPRQRDTERGTSPASLRGSVRAYEHPFEPAVSPDEWEAV